MIRFILVCIVVIAYLVPTIPVLLVEWIIGKFSHDYDISLAHGTGHIQIHPVDHRRQSHRHRRRKRSKGSGCSLCSNHRSYFLTSCSPTAAVRSAPAMLPRRKWSIIRCSPTGCAISTVSFSTERISSRARNDPSGRRLCETGISICIFPEGTRNKNADENRNAAFHDGSFKIAARAKSPDHSCIAISNSANIWEANFPKMTPTHVVIEYGKPIIPSELDRGYSAPPGFLYRYHQRNADQKQRTGVNIKTISMSAFRT